MGAPVAVAAAAMQPIISAEEGGISSATITRTTKSGRKLWYNLRVIQQPERARACGSGPKSSADRRPVDPPPVVELRIFEGQTMESAREKDVTFLYNANFFLYTTLEHARIMAHGRVQTPSANAPPVLTGMPVSGMAYLDRPEEAGYFVFPDLSVRHEGCYRLSFHLYEETKDDKDKDPDSPDSEPATPGLPSATRGSFDFRMEVKSQEFIVYSAKKFPGLTESTALSKVVAEQGCRVRIRRDVRMRRRDQKGSGDYDNNAEDGYTRRMKTETPDRDQYRARSMSGSSDRTAYPEGRRASMADYPPQFNVETPTSGNHLGFLGGNSSSQYPAQYPQQPQGYGQSQSVPASPTASYPPGQSSYPPPLPHLKTERPQSQGYGVSVPSPRDSAPYEQRRASEAYPLPAISPALSSPQTYSSPNGAPRSRHRASAPTPLPSLEDLTNRHSALVSPKPLPHPRKNSITSNGVAAILSSPVPPKQYAGSKRCRDEFSTDDSEPSRRQNGARDSGEVHDPLSTDGDLRYKRADGTEECKTTKETL